MGLLTCSNDAATNCFPKLAFQVIIAHDYLPRDVVVVDQVLEAGTDSNGQHTNVLPWAVLVSGE